MNVEAESSVEELAWSDTERTNTTGMDTAEQMLPSAQAIQPLLLRETAASLR